MPLTDNQQTEMYKSVLETRNNLKWIREEQENQDKAIKEHEEKITELEKKQAVISTKLGAFLLACVMVCTAVGNATLYLFQRWILK